MSNTTKAIHLDALGNGMPALTTHCGMMLAEAATVCLEHQGHSAGVELTLSGIQVNKVELHWTAGTDQMRRTYNDPQEATERGASAISILLAKDLTGMVVVDRTKKDGNGFDYWLGNDDEGDGINFLAGTARLEVSGLLSGTKSQLNARIKQKKEQMKPSDHLAPGYVGVVEFGQPIAHLELK